MCRCIFAEMANNGKPLLAGNDDGKSEIVNIILFVCV